MKTNNYRNILALYGAFMFISAATEANAQWPTLDIAAIKETVTSNLQLVKQSKLATDATKLGGTLNSTIGDAKSSMSKFASENLEKAQKEAEKLKKEKERLEEKKKKYEEKKEKLEKQKEKYEKAKQKIDDAKKLAADAKQQINDAKATYNEYKNEFDDYKALASEAGSIVNEYKDQAKEKAGISSGSSSVKEEIVTVGGGDANTYIPEISSDNKVYDDGMSSGGNVVVDETTAVPEENEDLSGGYGDGSNVPASDVIVNDDEVSENTEETVAEENPANISETIDANTYNGLRSSQLTDQEISDVLQNPLTDETIANMREKGVDEEVINNIAAQKNSQKVSSETEVQAETAPVAAPLSAAGTAPVRKAFGRAPVKAVSVSGTQNTIAAPQTLQVNSGTDLKSAVRATVQPLSRAAAPAVQLNAQTASETTAAVKDAAEKTLSISPDAVKAAPVRTFRQKAPLQKLQQGVWLGERSETIKVAYNETLAFGAEDSSMPDTGIVNNGEYDEKIFDEAIADYCPELKVKNLSNTGVTEECMKKLIRYQSDADAQIAASGKALYTQIMAGTITSLVAESMQAKNTAANYETKVLNKMEEEIGSASVTREDISAMSLTNKELQYLLNRILSVYSSQLLMDSLTQIGGFDKQNLGEDESDEGED